MRSLLADKFYYLIELFNYNKDLFQGPPFSVDLDEVKEHYGICNSKCSYILSQLVLI